MCVGDSEVCQSPPTLLNSMLPALPNETIGPALPKPSALAREPKSMTRLPWVYGELITMIPVCDVTVRAGGAIRARASWDLRRRPGAERYW